MRSRHNDEGFTLLEAVISMALVVIIFVGLGVTISVALRAVQERRAEQQALGVLTGVAESFADLEYAALALNLADLDHGFVAGDTHDQDGAGPLPDEEVAVDAAGAVDHLDTITAGGLTFTIQTFVTMVDQDPADASTDDLRRLFTTISWEIRGIPRERLTETVVAKRAAADALGFDFTLDDYAELVTVIPGQVVVFDNILYNVGAQDDFYDLVFESESGWSVTFDEPLDDWNSNALLDTETVAGGADLPFTVTVTVPADVGIDDSELIHITFLSNGDPTRSTVLEYVLDVGP